MKGTPVSSKLMLAGIILIIIAKENEAVDCYICSWSPHDNRSDTCTSGNFIPENTMIHNCDRGCEVVSMRDRNGEVEMFYRNCYSKSDSDYTSSKQFTGINEEEVYKCNWKLCNSAVLVASDKILLVLIFVVSWRAKYLPF